jgi:hypothetical protein
MCFCATILYTGYCIKTPYFRGVFKVINKKMRMKKLQRYEHTIVEKRRSFPNNASYDLKSWWIKIG